MTPALTELAECRATRFAGADGTVARFLLLLLVGGVGAAFERPRLPIDFACPER